MAFWVCLLGVIGGLVGRFGFGCSWGRANVVIRGPGLDGVIGCPGFWVFGAFDVS